MLSIIEQIVQLSGIGITIVLMITQIVFDAYGNGK